MAGRCKSTVVRPRSLLEVLGGTGRRKGFRRDPAAVLFIKELLTREKSSSALVRPECPPCFAFRHQEHCPNPGREGPPPESTRLPK